MSTTANDDATPHSTSPLLIQHQSHTQPLPQSLPSYHPVQLFTNSSATPALPTTSSSAALYPITTTHPSNITPPSPLIDALPPQERYEVSTNDHLDLDVVGSRSRVSLSRSNTPEHGGERAGGGLGVQQQQGISQSFHHADHEKDLSVERAPQRIGLMDLTGDGAAMIAPVQSMPIQPTSTTTTTRPQLQSLQVSMIDAATGRNMIDPVTGRPITPRGNSNKLTPFNSSPMHHSPSNLVAGGWKPQPGNSTPEKPTSASTMGAVSVPSLATTVMKSSTSNITAIDENSPDPINGGGTNGETDFYTATAATTKQRSSSSAHNNNNSNSNKHRHSHGPGGNGSGSNRGRRRCAECVCPASCGGYNFVKVFVILTACQVILTCLLVWLVGYLGLLSATNELSAQVRDSIMNGVIDNVTSRVSQPLEAAADIHHMTRYRFKDIDINGPDIVLRDGFLSDLYYIGLRFPDLSRIGFMSMSGSYVAIQKAYGGNVFTSQNGMIVMIYNHSSVTIHSYQPTPIPDRNRIANVEPLLRYPEMTDDDSAEYIYNYLGQPLYNDSFPLKEIKFLPSIYAGINSSAIRKAYPAAKNLETGWSPAFRAADRLTRNGTYDYLSLAAWAPTINPATGDLVMCGFAYFRFTDLENSFTELPFGSHGVVYVVRASGDILATSMPEVQLEIRKTQIPYVMGTSPYALVKRMRQFLLDWGLVLPGATSNVSLTTVPYTGFHYSASFSESGNGWRIEARQLEPSRSALPYTVVLLTYDKDFDGGAVKIITNSAITAGIICLIAMALAFGITRCLTRPLLSVVNYMDRAVRVISMDRGLLQRDALGELCEAWSSESGMILPPIFQKNGGAGGSGPNGVPNSSSTSQDLMKHPNLAVVDPFSKTPLYASFCWLCNDQGDSCCCFRVGRSLREVQAMHAAFGSMLYTLASYDELEAINQAKRSFIRYIFHEVRVPFNAIVLGIEQMQLDLVPYQNSLSTTFETLDILREQSAVVSRILNDVLSMQKIEDGALALEYDTFSLEKMIRGALYAFRTPCLEKRLKVRINLQSLDDLVNEALPGLRLGKTPLMIGGNGSKKVTSKVKSGLAQSNRLLPPAVPSSVASSPIATPNVIEMAGTTPMPHFVPSTPGASAANGASTVTTATAATGGSNDQPTPQQGRPPLHTQTFGPHSISHNPHAPSTMNGSTASAMASEVYHAQVRGDPYRLRQCLANFVSNAIKFTPIGGQIRVSLEISRFESNPLASIASDQLLLLANANVNSHNGNGMNDNGTRSSGGMGSQYPSAGWHAPPTPASRYDHDGSPPIEASQPATQSPPQRPVMPELLGTVLVRVAVKDSGSGIPVEHQAQLFNAYHQIGAGKAQKGNGTGLGLNISKSIIELHGGSIGFSSSTGGSTSSGSDFHFSLPMDVMLVRTGGKGESSATHTGYKGIGGALAHSQTGRSQVSQVSERKQMPLSLPISTNENVAISDLPAMTTATSAPPTQPMTPLPIYTGNNPMLLSLPSPHLHAVAGSANTTPTPPVPSALTANSIELTSIPPTPSRRATVDEDVPIPTFHDEVGDSNVVTTPNSGSSTKQGGTTIAESTAADSLYNNGPSASSSSSTTRTARPSQQRVLRGSALGVAIPSTSLSSIHSGAQNLTQSVTATPGVGSASSNGGGGSASASGSGSGLDSSATPAIPTPLARASTASSASSTPPLATVNPHAIQGLRTLVVEDSAPNRKLLMSLLKHMGCVPTGVENGQECVDLFKSVMSPSPSSKTRYITPQGGKIAPPVDTKRMYPFDIILMDGSMPVLNGVQATQILRQHGVLIPIVAVTGNALAEDVSAFTTAGANHVLTKPIARKKLHELLLLYAPQPASTGAAMSTIAEQ